MPSIKLQMSKQVCKKELSEPEVCQIKEPMTTKPIKRPPSS